MKLEYPIFSYIRLLLPCSVILFVSPPLFKTQMMNIYCICIFYFFGSYFVFINFPSLPEILHSKPTYVEDLVIEGTINDETFKQLYNVVMCFFLSALVGFFSSYIIIQGVDNLSLFELLGIIGGNIGLYMKVQGIIGKILLLIFYCFKEKKIQKNKRKESSEISIELEIS